MVAAFRQDFDSCQIAKGSCQDPGSFQRTPTRVLGPGLSRNFSGFDGSNCGDSPRPGSGLLATRAYDCDVESHIRLRNTREAFRDVSSIKDLFVLPRADLCIVSVCTATYEPGLCGKGTYAGSWTRGSHSQTSKFDLSVHVVDFKLVPFATPLSDVNCTLKAVLTATGSHSGYRFQRCPTQIPFHAATG